MACLTAPWGWVPRHRQRSASQDSHPLHCSPRFPLAPLSHSSRYPRQARPSQPCAGPRRAGFATSGGEVPRLGRDPAAAANPSIPQGMDGPFAGAWGLCTSNAHSSPLLKAIASVPYPKLTNPIWQGSLGVLSKETLVALQRLADALEAGEAAAAVADPGSPEALRADAELASATQHALAMMRAEEALGRLPRRGKARNERGRGRGAV